MIFGEASTTEFDASFLILSAYIELIYFKDVGMSYLLSLKRFVELYLMFTCGGCFALAFNYFFKRVLLYFTQLLEFVFFRAAVAVEFCAVVTLNEFFDDLY